jgi:hypothetical protein
MKKLTTIIAGLALLISASAFTNPDLKVPQSVMSAFNKNFTSVSNVSWQKADAFYFANFKIGSEEIEAAYDERGELVGYARKIDVSQLPLGISISLKEKFEDYTFTTPVSEL